MVRSKMNFVARHCCTPQVTKSSSQVWTWKRKKNSTAELSRTRSQTRLGPTAGREWRCSSWNSHQRLKLDNNLINCGENTCTYALGATFIKPVLRWHLLAFFLFCSPSTFIPHITKTRETSVRPPRVTSIVHDFLNLYAWCVMGAQVQRTPGTPKWQTITRKWNEHISWTCCPATSSIYRGEILSWRLSCTHWRRVHKWWEFFGLSLAKCILSQFWTMPKSYQLTFVIFE
jgi:hypothetical protein